ncbi:MAG: flagellar protein export ATPase FliI [Micavibrio aeruginosavorus]|uniref:Flagellum-specific ATP synthase n=1 Tax=Micavibrio aeruginosavorus TaxID=349221 RepID=A0A7T5R1U9_9BACT|nr:MAG: flagellar protein export ATPase FliI [Micavibrio aeruginosavorus]
MDRLSEQAEAAVSIVPDYEIYGRVTKVLGLLVEMAGFGQGLSIGAHVHLKPRRDLVIPCEVVGFRDNHALLMPFGSLEGVTLGCPAMIQRNQPVVTPDERWLGRVINGMGEPIDGLGPLPQGGHPIPLRNKPPAPHSRQRMGQQLDLGVRAVNTFLATCRGQRMGIFSGSGVGKSVLLSMMARYTAADVSVIGLVGERGREVQEFIQDDLGPEGLKRSVVIVATGDEPALMRRQAAYVTLATAEYFRNQGKQVLCLIDSLTRFAMAQREIGLSAGEPPTSKGYPPTTFGELARLLERAGPGAPGQGSITGLFAVLVEGDDQNEPISDAVRGIVDGHIVMEREIADRGRYPAINILKSVSRSMPKAVSDERGAIIKRAKQLITTYEDMAELIRLGAYRKGSDPKVDEAIKLYPQIEEFLTQRKEENTSIADGFARLGQIVGVKG